MTRLGGQEQTLHCSCSRRHRAIPAGDLDSDSLRCLEVGEDALQLLWKERKAFWNGELARELVE